MDPPSPCQLETFLRWTNFQLRAVQFRSPLPPERRVLSDLSGLSDGVLLSEVCGSLLSLREPLRVHYQPRVSSRKLENIHTCLSLMREHGVRLPSIGNCGCCCCLHVCNHFTPVGAEDILRGDLPALTGVIWSLVVRFQLSGDAKRAGSKKSVLLWTRAVLSNENVTIFRLIVTAVYRFCLDTRPSNQLGEWNVIIKTNLLFGAYCTFHTRP